MKKTLFSIPKMDCPSEESIIRMALDKSKEIKSLQFNLGARELTIFHEKQEQKLLSLLKPLNFGAQIKDSRDLSEVEEALELSNLPREQNQAKVLKQLLAINGGMFAIEIVLGIIAESTGLIADSLDMFADAAVYGLSLYAVGKTVHLKNRAAKMSGYLQLLLALFALAEVIRRFVFGSDPESNLMIGVALLALIANVTCLLLLSKQRKDEVHMKASWIFSTNDVIANVAVIVAGILVRFTGSPLPDLMIGLIISIVVFRGAVSILKLTR